MEEPEDCRACRNSNCGIIIKYKKQLPKCPCRLCLVKPVCAQNCREFYNFLEETYNNTTVETYQHENQTWAVFTEKLKDE